MYSIFYLLVSCALIGLAACWSAALLQYPFVSWACRVNLKRFSSSFWFTWGILPIVLGSFVVLFGCTFGWLSSIGWLPDHCTQHPGHPHLCLAHISQIPPGGGFFWGVALFCWIVLSQAAVRLFQRYLSTHQLLRDASPAETVARQGVSFALLPSRFPAVFTAGLFFPRLYLTKTAFELLNHEEQAIVLSHEREHIRRKDPLRLLLLTFCEYWLPGVRHIRRRWQRMAEIECDRASVRDGFSADRVALTILKLQRAGSEWRPQALTLAYSAQDSLTLRLRIESLVCDRRDGIGQAPILLGCVALCLFLILHSSEVHHGLETFLGWLSW